MRFPALSLLLAIVLLMYVLCSRESLRRSSKFKSDLSLLFLGFCLISLNNLPASCIDDSEKHKLISLWQLGLIQCCFNLEGNFSINAMSLRLSPFFCTSVHALHDHSEDELAVLVSDSS